MPLPGGASAKFGDRYEGRWTVLQLVDLLTERADALRLEPPGTEGEGVEFWVRRGRTTSYHQVKRQSSRASAWSIDEIGRSGVTAKLFAKLSDPAASCVFVSADSAGEFRDLHERARSAANWEEFDREFLKSTQARTNFDRIRQYVKDLTVAEVFDRLKRFELRTIDEATLQRVVESQLLPLVEGEPAIVAAVLGYFVFDNVIARSHRVNCGVILKAKGCDLGSGQRATSSFRRSLREIGCISIACGNRASAGGFFPASKRTPS
jgi:hypothetical protein